MWLVSTCSRSHWRSILASILHQHRRKKLEPKCPCDEENTKLRLWRVTLQLMFLIHFIGGDSVSLIIWLHKKIAGFSGTFESAECEQHFSTATFNAYVILCHSITCCFQKRWRLCQLSSKHITTNSPRLLLSPPLPSPPPPESSPGEYRCCILGDCVLEMNERMHEPSTTTVRPSSPDSRDARVPNRDFAAKMASATARRQQAGSQFKRVRYMLATKM